ADFDDQRKEAAISKKRPAANGHRNHHEEAVHPTPIDRLRTAHRLPLFLHPCSTSRPFSSFSGEERMSRKLAILVVLLAIVTAMATPFAPVLAQAGEPVVITWFVGLGAGGQPEHQAAQNAVVE